MVTPRRIGLSSASFTPFGRVARYLLTDADTSDRNRQNASSGMLPNWSTTLKATTNRLANPLSRVREIGYEKCTCMRWLPKLKRLESIFGGKNFFSSHSDVSKTT